MAPRTIEKIKILEAILGKAHGLFTQFLVCLDPPGISIHFQNVVLFRNVFLFSKCERFHEYFFPFSEKHNYKQKSSHSLQITDEFVNNKIYELLNLFPLSRIYNLLYITEIISPHCDSSNQRLPTSCCCSEHSAQVKISPLWKTSVSLE